ncbi:MAG: sugar phosphate isomerase/epimerase family protein [bacterium]
MKNFRIGVMSDSFRLEQREGIRKAAELGADGVQVYMTAPDKISKAARKDFKAFCADVGVEISALCGDVGAYREAKVNKERVACFKQILDLAGDVGTKVVTTHIGVVPEDKDDPIYKIMLSAVREMAEYAAKLGVVAAIETGPEKATTLKKFLDDVSSKGLGVNLDPANLVMVVADDPVQAVLTLKDYIVHTHAKDGIQLWSCDAVQAYHTGLPKDRGPAWKEVPLGEGSVKWDKYLTALGKIGFKGYLTIEREVGDNPAADIASAIAFLRKKMK